MCHLFKVFSKTVIPWRASKSVSLSHQTCKLPHCSALSYPLHDFYIFQFACMFCPKRCATKQDLDRHLMSHRGEAIFQCQYCEKSFVHRASLKKHQRGHLGERPYRCNPCDKNFGLLSVLQKHQKSHIRKVRKSQYWISCLINFERHYVYTANLL